MIRFPIAVRFTRATTEFRLNDEWTLRCEFDTLLINLIGIGIKSNRDITSGEVSINGTLLLSKEFHGGTTEHSFSKSKIMGTPRNHLINLVDLRSSFPISFQPDSEVYFLKGFITITFDKCAECVQSKSLVDNTTASPTKSLERLSNDFEQLLAPPTSCFADVNLICGDASISAHKVILSARSPVFAAMFKNPMKESHQNEVNIDDIEASVLRIMMNYIYTGKTSDLTVMSASDLLFAADKYQLQELKEICCDFLKKNVTLQNVSSLLVSGDLHSQDLKSFAMNYISKKCTNFSTIENTEEWKALRKERPSLAMDVLTFLVKARDKK